MATRKFTSPVLWLSQDDDDRSYDLHEREPNAEIAGVWGRTVYVSGKLIDSFCSDEIHRLFSDELNGKGKCRVKITIEVLDQ